MRSKDARTVELVKIAETDEEIASIRHHLQEVVAGSAFRGSQRSGQFLKYIVEQAIGGHFDALKERVIGVELFGRSASYDTGEDAIVRVTASDVRRRLLQHYGKCGASCGCRINLLPGSYIPEIVRETPASNVHQLLETAQEMIPAREASVVTPAGTTQEPRDSNRRSKTVWKYLFAVLNLAALLFLCNHFLRSRPQPAAVLPWSALFQPSRSTLLITSDPDIQEIQNFTGRQISVSDYANHRYLPQPNSLSSQQEQYLSQLSGDKAAFVDTSIAAGIAELAEAHSAKLIVQAARDLRLSDLLSDDNLILLGSPHSNPWSLLFNDLLDFRFIFDKDSKQEYIRNVHPRPGELSTYVPTALGGATGQSFAIISFLQNPNQDGQVLLLAGANAEGTQAAGNLIKDLPRLSAALQKCGIPPSGALRHFQLLLRLNIMAGTPSNVDVLACHPLPGS